MLGAFAALSAGVKVRSISVGYDSVSALASPVSLPSTGADTTTPTLVALFLLAAGTAWLWSLRASGQTEKDENGNPVRLPGQPVTPDTRYRERQSIERQRQQELQDRARARSDLQQQQFQNDRAQAQSRENAIQQQFQQQQLDILNNRDKP